MISAKFLISLQALWEGDIGLPFQKEIDGLVSDLVLKCNLACQQTFQTFLLSRSTVQSALD